MIIEQSIIQHPSAAAIGLSKRIVGVEWYSDEFYQNDAMLHATK